MNLPVDNVIVLIVSKKPLRVALIALSKTNLQRENAMKTDAGNGRPPAHGQDPLFIYR